MSLGSLITFKNYIVVHKECNNLQFLEKCYWMLWVNICKQQQLSFLTFQSKIFLQVLDEIMFWNLIHMLSLAWERLLTFFKYIRQGVSCCLKIFWVYLLMWALCEQEALLEPVLKVEGVPDLNSPVESWQAALLNIHPLSRKILMFTEEKN